MHYCYNFTEFPEQCSVHFINNGITIHEDRVMVEFAVVGVNADGRARCGINELLRPCKLQMVPFVYLFIYYFTWQVRVQLSSTTSIRK